MDEILVPRRRGHESLITHECRRFIYELRLFAKMQLDTLRQFRADLPPFWSFVPPRLIAILCPGFDFPPIMTCAAVPVGGASPPKMKSRRRTSSSTAAGHTTDHDLSIQEAALRATGCDTIRAEKLSGTTTQGREALQTVLDFLRPGDVPMVTCH